MIKEYDIVRLKKSLPSKNLSIGAQGTVLMVFDEPGLPLAYEVEFLDEKGNSLAVVTLKWEDVEKLQG